MFTVPDKLVALIELLPVIFPVIEIFTTLEIDPDKFKEVIVPKLVMFGCAAVERVPVKVVADNVDDDMEFIFDIFLDESTTKDLPAEAVPATTST